MFDIVYSHLSAIDGHVQKLLWYSSLTVQNGSLHQKDAVHDSDFEPYLPGQSNQVSGRQQESNS